MIQLAILQVKIALHVFGFGCVRLSNTLENFKSGTPSQKSPYFYPKSGDSSQKYTQNHIQSGEYIQNIEYNSIFTKLLTIYPQSYPQV